MQQFKSKFKELTLTNTTIGNIQSCIRLNDFNEVGDGTHSCCFKMIGLFSFRHWTVENTIQFWVNFIEKRLQLPIDYVTVHKDKHEWISYHSHSVKFDDGCIWSDGEIGGYCTEFYVNGIEIGNIVNPLGNCIDVGFGYERLECLVNGTKPRTKLEELIDCSKQIIDSKIQPSNKQHGYVLRKLLREIYKCGGELDHPFFKTEIERQKKLEELYNKLKYKHLNKSDEWWYSTHGIDFNFIKK